jgi:hypothetical protein
LAGDGTLELHGDRVVMRGIENEISQRSAGSDFIETAFRVGRWRPALFVDDHRLGYLWHSRMP